MFGKAEGFWGALAGFGLAPQETLLSVSMTAVVLGSGLLSDK
jgi:hypothetical protein